MALRGGSSRFRFSRFLAYTLRCAFSFHPNYPYEGLKWPWEWFLTVSEIKNFLTFFILGEFPKPRKFFFQDFENSKCSTGRNSQYFLTGPGLIERKNDFAHTYEPKSEDFGPEGSPGPRIPKMSAFFGKKSEKHRKRSKSPQIDLYVCAKSIYLSFKPGFIKKYWELRPVEHFEQTGFRKKKFSSFGNSPKTKEVRKFWFLETVRNHSHGHFKPSYG